MILVINGNGRVGQSVVSHLVNEHGLSPRVMVRDTNKARTNLATLGTALDIVEGDITRPESIADAMRGVDAVFLCTPVDPNQVQHQGNVVREAAKSGAYVVKVSGLATAIDSPVDSGRWHAETEQQIRTAGVPHAFLHPNFFQQNLAFQFQSARDKGVIRSAVAEQSIAMVNADDIGAAAAALLAKPQADNTFLLTESRGWSYAEIAECFTRSMGREVRFEVQAKADVERALQASGQPEWHVKLLLQFNDAFNAGAATITSDAVERLVHRPAISLPSYLASAEPVTGQKNPFPSE